MTATVFDFHIILVSRDKGTLFMSFIRTSYYLLLKEFLTTQDSNQPIEQHSLATGLKVT